MYEENEHILGRDNCMYGNDLLNEPFTVCEVTNAIITLKCNKAAGPDLFVNEFLKCSVNKLGVILTKLLNVVLQSGLIHEDWCMGIIVPIYKKKGDEGDPNNIRGNSSLSCFWKLFTSLISSRTSKYLENFELLGAEQAGFRNGFSTCDHIFVL